MDAPLYPAATGPSAQKAGPRGNPFGIGEAIGGIVVGFLLSSILVTFFAATKGHNPNVDTLRSDIWSLVGLWAGFAGAAIFASRSYARRHGVVPTWKVFRSDFGVELRLWPDLLIGIVVGLGSQYLLVPLLELPLLPFVPHLFTRLSSPAKSLTGGVQGANLVILGFLVCLGSPMFEELFFRGLLLRGLVGRCAGLRPLWQWVVPIVVSGVLFGLLHFEPLQLIGLIGFGIVLGILATKTRRLGPGFIAHMAFNATTFIALAIKH